MDDQASEVTFPSTVDTEQVEPIKLDTRVRLKRYPGNPILAKNPTHNWEAGSVFNPNVLYDNGIFRMLYRATNDIQTEKPGAYMSSIGYAESRDGIHFTRHSEPLLSYDQPYENRLGCEDARVTKIDGQYFVFYTAVGGEGENWRIRLALATSRDFKTFTKHGIVGPAHTTSKAAILFPEKVGGKYVMFYTWRSDSPMSSIMQARFDRLEDVISPPPGFMADNIDHFEENLVFEPGSNHTQVTYYLQPREPVYRGAEVGAVPIKTSDGWLFVYCNANTSDHPEWSISAALLDLDDPRRVLAVTEEPLLRPNAEEKINGVVKNATFPTGAVVVGDELYVYYGSGDLECCLATCNFNELLGYLKSQIRR